MYFRKNKRFKDTNYKQENVKGFEEDNLDFSIKELKEEILEKNIMKYGD